MVNAPQFSDANILIVDDYQPNVLLLDRVLRSAGYKNVRSTTDPREVESLYAAQNFDIILLDINMPHMSGFDVMERLRTIERDSYLPILVLTAQADYDTRLRALQSGAKDFLTKPFDNLEVLTRIANILEVRMMHNRVREQNRDLERRVHERTRELNDTRLEIIRRLGRAAEYRDNNTGQHIMRMSKYSEALARAAGLTDGEAEVLLNASPMHDIGKIGIPDRILLKASSLDPEEKRVMETHTTIGAELLSHHPSELMQAARVIALTHHERWDGSGYPQKLRGEDIPLHGRIVALCDVFDALTTKRPYKAAFSVDKSVEYLRDNSGKHFDPGLVERFLGILPEILAIMGQYPEPSGTA
jgi:putative two-component system response regulator